MASNTVIFITGANTGLGYETVRSLLQSSKAYTLLLGGRSIEKADAAAQEALAEFPSTASSIATVQIDIESDDSIFQAFDNVSTKYGRLDILVNNAGAQLDPQVPAGKMTMREMWNKSWDVNITGTHILTHTFAPLILKSSNPRLIFITSGTSTLGESENMNLVVNKPPAKGWPKQGFNLTAYRSSKTGLNMVMREWSRLLKEDGVKVWAISPGFLATGLGDQKELLKKMGAEDPTLGANFIRDVIEGARDGDMGKVVRRNDIQPW